MSEVCNILGLQGCIQNDVITPSEQLLHLTSIASKRWKTEPHLHAAYAAWWLRRLQVQIRFPDNKV